MVSVFQSIVVPMYKKIDFPHNTNGISSTQTTSSESLAWSTGFNSYLKPLQPPPFAPKNIYACEPNTRFNCTLAAFVTEIILNITNTHLYTYETTMRIICTFILGYLLSSFLSYIILACITPFITWWMPFVLGIVMFLMCGTLCTYCIHIPHKTRQTIIHPV